MKTKLFIAASLFTLLSCESKWQMNTKVSETIYYQCKGPGKTTKSETNWIFEGTRKEAEAQQGTKFTSDYEYPYCVNRERYTILMGKE